MSNTTKRSRIMEILERETGGQSFKSHKYSLDNSERSPVEYGEATNTVMEEARRDKGYQVLYAVGRIES